MQNKIFVVHFKLKIKIYPHLLTLLRNYMYSKVKAGLVTHKVEVKLDSYFLINFFTHQLVLIHKNFVNCDNNNIYFIILFLINSLY